MPSALQAGDPIEAQLGFGAAGEWRLCHDGQCHTLSEILGHPVGASVTTKSACE
jgi:hypothetical protein